MMGDSNASMSMTFCMPSLIVERVILSRSVSCSASGHRLWNFMVASFGDVGVVGPLAVVSTNLAISLLSILPLSRMSSIWNNRAIVVSVTSRGGTCSTLRIVYRNSLRSIKSGFSEGARRRTSQIPPWRSAAALMLERQRCISSGSSAFAIQRFLRNCSCSVVSNTLPASPVSTKPTTSAIEILPDASPSNMLKNPRTCRSLMYEGGTRNLFRITFRNASQSNIPSQSLSNQANITSRFIRLAVAAALALSRR
mmetsp:Transcript_86450/g.241924  ORF Transcript_86450/g.241924 Transcript_86450/m.241924 type:complete len:253 (+) Transcript_86450:255-1013(+)